LLARRFQVGSVHAAIDQSRIWSGNQGKNLADNRSFGGNQLMTDFGDLSPGADLVL